MFYFSLLQFVSKTEADMQGWIDAIAKASTTPPDVTLAGMFITWVSHGYHMGIMWTSHEYHIGTTSKYHCYIVLDP